MRERLEAQADVVPDRIRIEAVEGPLDLAVEPQAVVRLPAFRTAGISSAS
jgi:hypothetical protein